MGSREFVSSSVGLVRWISDKKRALVRVQVYRTADGFELVAVRGENLSRIKSIKRVLLTAEEYEARPRDAYDSLVETVWLLERVGLSVDCENEVAQ